MQENKENIKQEPELIPSQTPTSATDYVNIAGSKDGSVLMQFLSVTPEYIYENHRTVINEHFVNELIDILCSVREYYPKKPRKKTVSKKRERQSTPNDNSN